MLGIACLAVLVVAGCGGQDLAKENSPRTIVTAEPGGGGSGSVPEGPFNDPALAPDALRGVDACQVLSAERVSQLGTPDEPRAGGAPDQCSVSVTDVGSKKLDVTLRIGEDMLGALDKATGGLEGLPVVESKLEDTGTCFVKVLTSEEPMMGLGVQLRYPDGEPCGAGRKVMAKVIQLLKTSPPKVDGGEGSLLTVEPCSKVDDKVAGAAVGDGARRVPSGLHGCMLTAGGGPTGHVQFRFAYPPTEEKNTTEVPLSGSVKALVTFEKPDDARCKAEWLHKADGEDKVEVVEVRYSDYIGDDNAEVACQKVTALAKSVVAKLPKT